jgi:hypothetical protein
MGTFDTLRAIREFEKQHLSFIRTMEDLDIVREIGFHQEAGKPITLNELLALQIASVATVQRRLAELKAQAVVEPRPLNRDRRSFELLLSPAVLKAYASYIALLKKLARRAK